MLLLKKKGSSAKEEKIRKADKREKKLKWYSHKIGGGREQLPYP